ncbi:MAG: hypothetical protein WC740_21725 [Verrucomicrobiia bacterium]
MKPLSRLVIWKLRVMFPDPVVRSRIDREIQRYGDSGEPQVDRVRLAILKLSEGQFDNINVAGAKEDPLDTILWAERPRWIKRQLADLKLRPDDEDVIDALDWEEYHDWLAKGLK